MNLFLDTHVLLWLYKRDAALFSRESLDIIDNSILFFPVLSYLEIQFLKEVKRITFPPEKLINELQADLPITFAETDTVLLMKKAVDINWTRDPFDRLIVAEAALHDAHLLTKDSSILSKYNKAVWY